MCDRGRKGTDEMNERLFLQSFYRFALAYHISVNHFLTGHRRSFEYHILPLACKARPAIRGSGALTTRGDQERSE